MRAFHLRYLALAALACGAYLGAIAGVVYAMDPTWCFGTAHAPNHRQQAFDERRQKTNLMVRRPPDYDAVLLGSSRVTYVDRRDFVGVRVLNYAASEMRPEEYAGFVANAAAHAGRPPRVVFVGLDFDGTSAHRRPGAAPLLAATYLADARDPFGGLKTLVSADALDQALADFRLNRGRADRAWYDADHVKHVRDDEDDRALMARFLHQERSFRRIYRFGYRYDPAYAANLRALRAAFPDTRFVAFTTPVSAPLFEAMIDEGRLPDYRRWLTEAVDVFGEVTHFMPPSEITRTPRHFADVNHLRPEVCRLIARRLTAGEVRPGFGVVLTRAVLARYLAEAATPAAGR